MLVRERLKLARDSYHRALAAVRALSTPRSWRRLLAAARNLRAAERERGSAPPPNGLGSGQPP